MKSWMLFVNRNNKKVLAKLSLEDVHEGEVESTVGLLAYENGVAVEDIIITYE